MYGPYLTMAPSAMTTLMAHFENTHTTPDDYDLILTGDLGKLGSEILMDLMENKGVKLGSNYGDCGQMMFTDEQRTFQGGSGAGCSASVLTSYVLKKLESGEFKKVLFAPTGALLSPLSSQQGDSVPGICHAFTLLSPKYESPKRSTTKKVQKNMDSNSNDISKAKTMKLVKGD